MTSDSAELVKMTLLLGYGQAVSVQLRHDDPVVQQLISAYGEGGHTDTSAFALPRCDGAGSVIVRARDIVAITTDRIIVRPESAEREPQFPEQAETHLLIADFMLPQTHAALLNYTQQRQLDFMPSTVTSTSGKDVVDLQQRISHVLMEFPQFRNLFLEKLNDRFTQACRVLGIPEFPVGNVECQLTAHGNGGFFKRHQDVGSGSKTGRTISYVYYFFREPKGFTGGNLRLYPDGSSQVVDLPPRNNSIVFFSSTISHDVEPITVPSKNFSDYRFTVNGWIHKAAA